MATTREGLLLGGEWRERLAFGEVIAEGALTRADRQTGPANAVIDEGNEYRGHLFADAILHPSDRWRVTANYRFTSDDTFLRLYDYSEDDVLVSRVLGERFGNRSYLQAFAFTVDDIRPNADVDQPTVLPHARLSGDLGQGRTAGGTLGYDLGLVSLLREEEIDFGRLNADLGWSDRWTTGFGMVVETRAETRGDLYWLPEDRRDEDDAAGWTGRFFPQGRLDIAWPLVRSYGEGGQFLIEPRAAFDVAPTVIGTTTGIPNEDSRDVEFDTTNLFRLNRFPGRDRIEDGNRLTMGLRAGLFAPDGSFASLFLGQTQRFSSTNLFPEGSGLEQDLSDLVGRLQLNPGRLLDVDYRFRLDSESFASRLHEVNFVIGREPLLVAGNYVFVSEVAGTGIGQNRNELTLDVRTRLTERWRSNTLTRFALGGQARLLETAAVIAYEDECFTFSANLSQDFTDPAGDLSGTSIFFRIGLLALGEVESPDFF